jgi:hypothetical protein
LLEFRQDSIRGIPQVGGQACGSELVSDDHASRNTRASDRDQAREICGLLGGKGSNQGAFAVPDQGNPANPWLGP